MVTEMGTRKKRRKGETGGGYIGGLGNRRLDWVVGIPNLGQCDGF